MNQNLQGFAIEFIFHPNEITIVLKLTFENFTLNIILLINLDLVLSNMGQNGMVSEPDIDLNNDINMYLNEENET